MKKLGIICFSFFLLLGCINEGKNVSYPYKKGDLKLTILEDYIIIDTLDGFGKWGEPLWRFKQSISRSDSTACCELLEKILKR